MSDKNTSNIKTTKDQYKKMVKKATPRSHLLIECVKAFFVGGTICEIGQVITSCLKYYGVPKDDAAMYTAVILIFLGTLLTGLGIYDKIGDFGGAGSVVPITGFSNSVTAPAIEFKKEGYVLGVGAKMFLIAGPVIVYGTAASIVVGIVYYILKQVL